MTRDQLAEKLDHLDPGANLTIEANELAQIFGASTLSYEAQHVLQDIAAFALEHRCTFSFHSHEGATPCFEKDDIF